MSLCFLNQSSITSTKYDIDVSSSFIHTEEYLVHVTQNWRIYYYSTWSAHSQYHFHIRRSWSLLKSIKHSLNAYNIVLPYPFPLSLQWPGYYPRSPTSCLGNHTVYHLWLSWATEVTVSLDNKVTMATVMTKMRQGSSDFPAECMGGCGVASVGARVVTPCFLKNASGPKLKRKKSKLHT